MVYSAISTTAGLKQFFYTLFVGSWLFGFAKWLSDRFQSLRTGVLVSTLISGTLASALILGMHSLRGTPEPLLSSIPAISVGVVLLPIVLIKHGRPAEKI